MAPAAEGGGGFAGVSVELGREIEGVRIADLIGDAFDRLLGQAEQPHRGFHAAVDQEVDRGFAEVLAEKAVQRGRAEPEFRRDPFDGVGAVEMRVKVAQDFLEDFRVVVLLVILGQHQQDFKGEQRAAALPVFGAAVEDFTGAVEQRVEGGGIGGGHHISPVEPERGEQWAEQRAGDREGALEGVVAVAAFDLRIVAEPDQEEFAGLHRVALPVLGEAQRALFHIFDREGVGAFAETVAAAPPLIVAREIDPDRPVFQQRRGVVEQKVVQRVFPDIDAAKTAVFAVLDHPAAFAAVFLRHSGLAFMILYIIDRISDIFCEKSLVLKVFCFHNIYRKLNRNKVARWMIFRF